MAAIDKTYLNNYKIYKVFLDWAKKTTYTCPNGLTYNVYDYTYPYWTEKSMKDQYRPVLISSYTLDYFLIKYCPFLFVQERLKEVYDEDYYWRVKNGYSEYDTFKYPEIGTHFTIVRGQHLKHKDYLWALNRRKMYFDITVEYNDSPLWYNSKLKRFLLPNELGDGDTNWSYKGRTVKSLLRHLRKMKLPRGAIITAKGRYINEDLLILVK